MDDCALPHRARRSLEGHELDDGGIVVSVRRCTSEESLSRMDAGLDTPSGDVALRAIRVVGGPSELVAQPSLAVANGGAPAEPPPDTAAAPSEPLVLEWRRLRAFVRVPDMAAPRRWCAAMRAPPMRRRQILFGCSGVAKPGTLLGVLGPSGSGKTSLLSILGGRSEAEVNGVLLVNGAPGLPKNVRRRIGFVTQDDLMWASLSVEATLTYASQLRLPEALPREQKAARVEHIINLLGLDKCRGTQIGGPMQRGVSGGERKRVSIALELLTDPALLLLDEPTSGLDSTIAAKLVATLRGLSAAGRAIVASIHQPSTRCVSHQSWRMCLRLLLTSARCAFCLPQRVSLLRCRHAAG
jgi:ABC-type lipoprotein export system ATPase subunit